MSKSNNKPPAEAVTYGQSTVRIYPRADGQVAINWRESGKTKRTTRSNLESARQHAKATARKLDAATGQRWITPGQSDRLQLLEKLAGGSEYVPAFLQAAQHAVEALGSFTLIPQAADYFKSHGPAGARQITLHAAADIVLAEYDNAPRETLRTMKQSLNDLKSSLPDIPLTSITREMVAAHIHKPGVSRRTVRNRLSQCSTFFNRCRELEFWPHQRAIPTASIKPPKLDDKAPEIFTPTHGKILLKKTISECPQYLTYLITAGWLMCRPSECLRLRWPAFDLEHKLLHLSAQVVGKTHRERWVPIPPQLIPWLKLQKENASSSRVCLTTAREKLSILAREHGMEWPKDILRHSAITYRLQILGDIEKTAEEAGNSPTVIRADYRRPIPPGWGKKWLALVKLLPTQ